MTNSYSKNSWFSGCHHFGHINVIKFDKRPFENIEENDYELIKRHNSIVKDTDNVFFLGDFSFIKDHQHVTDILKNMNGIKHLILGNHDERIESNLVIYDRYFKNIVSYMELFIEEQRIICSHYPMFNWNRDYKGSWMLHSHNHGKNRYDKSYKITDVGVMTNNYYPYSYNQLKIMMNNKKNKEFGSEDE